MQAVFSQLVCPTVGVPLVAMLAGLRHITRFCSGPVMPCTLAVCSVYIHVVGVVSVRTARQTPGKCLCSLQKGPEAAGPASALL